MRIGVVGPADKSRRQLRRGLALLMDDPDVRQIIYLGMDGAAREVAEAWSRERMSPEQFVMRGASLAENGTATEIAALLDEERSARRLQVIRRLPDPPARAIEMLDRWIVLAVHDKAVLDEDDIANAHIIVYGKSDSMSVKHFGPRCFFTPGPVAKGRVGRLELLSNGQVEVRGIDLDGNTVLQEGVRTSSAKLVVTS